jgi:hypothetical protein
MKSQLNGTTAIHTEQLASPRLRLLMEQAESVPHPLLQSLTQDAYEQSAASRQDRIAVLAYYISEARAFAPGHEAEDWLLAQSRIDAIDAGTLEE